MQGYLDRPDLTEKVIKDGWYCTGDIAMLDQDGFITITGRESRFSKVAGEMVPHINVEEALNKELEASDGELLAVVSSVRDATKGEKLVVFHTCEIGDPQALCRRMASHGFPNLWIPGADAFCRIDEIPVLGTGKLDLKHLSNLAQKHFGLDGQG